MEGNTPQWGETNIAPQPVTESSRRNQIFVTCSLGHFRQPDPVVSAADMSAADRGQPLREGEAMNHTLDIEESRGTLGLDSRCRSTAP